MAVSILDPRQTGITTCFPATIICILPCLGETTAFCVTSRRTILGTLADTPVNIPLAGSSGGGLRSGFRFTNTEIFVQVTEFARTAIGGRIKHLDRLVGRVSSAVVGATGAMLLTRFIGVIDVEFVGVGSSSHGNAKFIVDPSVFGGTASRSTSEELHSGGVGHDSATFRRGVGGGTILDTCS